MIVQVHLGRLLWWACVRSGSHVPKPIIRIDQLEDLGWLTDDEQATDVSSATHE